MDVREVGGGESAEGDFDREGNSRALPSSLSEKGNFFDVRSWCLLVFSVLF